VTLINATPWPAPFENCKPVVAEKLELMKATLPRRHHAAAGRENDLRISQALTVPATDKIVGPLDEHIFDVGARGAHEHRVEPAEQRDVLEHVFVAGRL
jgi:hypothetical protein